MLFDRVLVPLDRLEVVGAAQAAGGFGVADATGDAVDDYRDLLP